MVYIGPNDIRNRSFNVPFHLNVTNSDSVEFLFCCLAFIRFTLHNKCKRMVVVSLESNSNCCCQHLWISSRHIETHWNWIYPNSEMCTLSMTHWEMWYGKIINYFTQLCSIMMVCVGYFPVCVYVSSGHRNYHHYFRTPCYSIIFRVNSGYDDDAWFAETRDQSYHDIQFVQAQIRCVAFSAVIYSIASHERRMTKMDLIRFMVEIGHINCIQCKRQWTGLK